MKRNQKIILGVLLAAAVGAGLFGLYRKQAQSAAYYDTTYSMSTVVTQTVYGPSAEQAMNAVDETFRAFEDRLSLYNDTSEVAAINAGAGTPVAVSADTYALIKRSLQLSAGSEGAFDVTIAPLTLLWGVTTDHPKVPPQADIDAALALVDDSAVVLNDAAQTVQLAAGQGIDLGGIAKGNACTVAQKVYEQYGVKSAVLNIGGNVYIRGKNPDGSKFRVGFRDPAGDENSYIAAVEMEDQVMAVSGGYERYFEENGVKYCHIINGQTGWPVQSDIASVGVVSEDGTLADFMSTTLYVWGEEKTKAYMAQHPELPIILLDGKGGLFVSAALKDSFELTQDAAQTYTVQYI